MRTTFVNKENGNSSLILIFAGWSADSSLFSDIRRKGWDTAVVHDFSGLDFDNSILDNYSTVYLYAWSLGVFAASKSVAAEKITAAFAVNGTLKPVDDIYGIPVAIYDGTEQNLSDKNLQKFRRRMFSSSTLFNDKLQSFTKVNDIDNLRHQLRLIKNETLNQPKSLLKWGKAYIGNDDRIIPPANQYEAWKKEETEIIRLNESHYVDLMDIIDATIPDSTEVGKHFTRALPSYNRHASAQKVMAEHLAGILDKSVFTKNPSVLEIGPGSGAFTRLYSPIIKPGSVDFVDVADIPAFKIADEEHYHICDAEEFLRTTAKKWDIVLCAATMQWFVNPEEFIRNVASVLNPGGLFLASSFLPGNLSELDAIRPAPLLYPSKNRLTEWMNQNFGITEIKDESIKLEFDSFRQLLMHLRHTGVGAAGKLAGNKSVFRHSDIRSLTYRAVYLKGEKQTSAT